MKYVSLYCVVFTLLLSSDHLSAQTNTQGRSGISLSEKEKIEYLIQCVEELKDVKFWRNGTYYDSKTAVAHLRMKLEKAGPRVKTADDFIRLIASCSSLTKIPYRIRFFDGTEVEAREFFMRKLTDLNKQHQ